MACWNFYRTGLQGALWLLLILLLWGCDAVVAPGAAGQSASDEPAYRIDFLADPPLIARHNDQLATITGQVLHNPAQTPTGLNYVLTIQMEGGPGQNDLVAFPPLAGRGITRFANNLEPQLGQLGGLDVLFIRLLGVVGESDDPAQGLGVSYHRDPSAQAVVTLAVAEGWELANVRLTLAGIDMTLAGEGCPAAEPNNYRCGGAFSDRVTMLTGGGGYLYAPADERQIAITGDVVTTRFADSDNSGFPDTAEDRRVAADSAAGNVVVFHPDVVGSSLQFRLDDLGKGVDGDADGLHDFDAPEQVIGLASGITFDLVAVVPTPEPTVDPNLTTISGVVFGDGNENGRFDPTESPLENVEIVLQAFTNPSFRKIMTTTLGANGQPPGTFLLEAVDAGHPYIIEARIPLPALPGGETLNPLRLVQPITPTVAGPNHVQFAAWPFALDNAAALTADFLLPDLQPLTHYPIPDTMSLSVADEIRREYPGVFDWYLDSETQPGRLLLRFGTLAVNLGNGPLHVLRSSSTLPNAPVYQRLYTAAGAYADQPVSDFVFHEGHNHVHVEAFELYNLRDMETDQIVANSPKISFCLTDVLYPIEPARALSAPIATVPMGWTCGDREQSINVGYSDYYGPALPDQWIDVTDVASGRYWLEIIVDPDNRLLELDEQNNTLRIEIEFTNPLPES